MAWEWWWAANAKIWFLAGLRWSSPSLSATVTQDITFLRCLDVPVVDEIDDVDAEVIAEWAGIVETAAVTNELVDEFEGLAGVLWGLQKHEKQIIIWYELTCNKKIFFGLILL